MSLLAAVKELKQSAHLLTAIKCRFGSRLPLDLRLIVMSFLTAGEATSLLSVSSSWQKLRRENERCSRLLYRLFFGECSARDMELFEFSSESSWRHRFDVQFGTARNWSTEAGAVVTSKQVATSLLQQGVIDGHVLVCGDSGQQQFDLPSLEVKSDPLKKPVLFPDEFSMDPTISIERDYPNILVHDKRSGRLLRQIQYNPSHVYCDPLSDCIACHHGGYAGADNNIAIWSSATGQLLTRISGNSFCHAVPHNGELFVAATGPDRRDPRVLTVFDMRTGKALRSAPLRDNSSCCGAATPDTLVIRSDEYLTTQRVRLVRRADLSYVDQPPLNYWDIYADASGRSVIISDDQEQLWTIHRQRFTQLPITMPCRVAWFCFNARYLVYYHHSKQRLVLHDFSVQPTMRRQNRDKTVEPQGKRQRF